MYKDKALQKEANRIANQRYRRKGITQGITEDGYHAEGITDKRTLHLAKALIDPVKRAKLILIHRALNRTVTGLGSTKVRLSDEVRYGVNGFTFSEIGELLI